MSASAARPQVSIKNVTKTFKRRRRETVHALREVNLDVEQGELLVLLGPSGCGKTTLLRTIVGLEQPTTGQITLTGEVVSNAAERIFVQPNRRDVGMVFQNYALWPHMTVRNNVAYPLRARRRSAEIASGRVEDVLEIVQCGHLADRYPPELSGGQQQRVSLARAMAAKPALMLLDEPLSNLDALLRVDLRAQLRLMHREIGFTGIYVTHDQEEALTLGSRIAVMEAGRISQLGTPQEIYDYPANEYVAQFLGVRNRLEIEVDREGHVVLDGAVLHGFSAKGAAGQYALRARPNGLRIRRPSAENPADGLAWVAGAKVVEVLPGGDTLEYMIQLASTVIYVQMPRDVRPLSPGEHVDLGIDPRSAVLYDQAGLRVPR